MSGAAGDRITLQGHDFLTAGENMVFLINGHVCNVASMTDSTAIIEISN
jgi:hypothetical protein